MPDTEPDIEHMLDAELDLERIAKAARDSLRFGGDRQVAQYCLDLVADVRRLEEKQRDSDCRTIPECQACDDTPQIDPGASSYRLPRPSGDMQPDLDRIEAYADQGDGMGMDRRLVRNCLDLAREVRFWRDFVCRHLAVVTACPGCEYQIEVDPVDLYRMFDKPKPHCLGCGCILSVRVHDSATGCGLTGSNIS